MSDAKSSAPRDPPGAVPDSGYNALTGNNGVHVLIPFYQRSCPMARMAQDKSAG